MSDKQFSIKFSAGVYLLVNILFRFAKGTKVLKQGNWKTEDKLDTFMVIRTIYWFLQFKNCTIFSQR